MEIIWQEKQGQEELHHHQHPQLREEKKEARGDDLERTHPPSEEGPSHKGRAPNLQSLHKPSRDGIITPGMSDLTNHGYRSQEVTVSNARTSGVFWHNAGVRDLRQFPGTTKKTLHRQSLEYVFVPGTSPSYNVGHGEQDPLQWPGVRPPDKDPG